MWGPYCCVVLWWRFQLVGAGFGGGGVFDPSLALRWLAPTTRRISCLYSSLGRVPAWDAGDPGSIPGGGKLNACPLPGCQLTSTYYSQYKPVLRIWIRCLFDTGIRNRFYPDPGSRILDPSPIFLRTYWQFWLKSSIILWKLAQIFFSAVQNWNELQYCEICGYIKSYDNKIFSPLSFVAVFGTGISDG